MYRFYTEKCGTIHCIHPHQGSMSTGNSGYRQQETSHYPSNSYYNIDSNLNQQYPMTYENACQYQCYPSVKSMPYNSQSTRQSSFNAGPHVEIVSRQNIIKERTVNSGQINKNVGTQQKRNGGRKPIKASTKEEEDRLTLRRERNKIAAARCRKRRLDYINQLMKDVKELESTKNCLYQKIGELQETERNIRSYLEKHTFCSTPKVKNPKELLNESHSRNSNSGGTIDVCATQKETSTLEKKETMTRSRYLQASNECNDMKMFPYKEETLDLKAPPPPQLGPSEGCLTKNQTVQLSNSSSNPN